MADWFVSVLCHINTTDLWVVFITTVIPLSHSPIRHTVNAPLTITPSLSLIAHPHIIAIGVLFRGARHLQRIFVL